MPKKSLAALSTVPALSSARLEPPKNFNPGYAAEWRAIVDSLPADYFRPGDIPLLVAYCAASARHKEADDLLADNGLLLLNDRGSWVANPAVAIMQSQATTLAQLASKLRLCPSSRYNERMAGSKAGTRAKGERPWQEEIAPLL